MLIHAGMDRGQTEVAPLDAEMMQPNAVDLRAGRVFRRMAGTFTLDGDHKGHLPETEILPDEKGFFNLKTGYYEVEFLQRVAMGMDEAGWVVVRSSLMRNGIKVYSALYDSGYVGKMVAGLEVPDGVVFRFPKGERIAQFVVCAAQSLKGYNGSYQESAL